VMFCATPSGCPPSNCLDSGNNQLFQSYGRKKRSVNNNDVSEKDDENTEETLSAIIRVLAAGEEPDELEPPKAEHRSENIVQVEARIPEEMMCIAESSFIAIIVTVSLLCVLFSGIIVAWGCARLRANASKTAAYGRRPTNAPNPVMMPGTGSL